MVAEVPLPPASWADVGSGPTDTGAARRPSRNLDGGRGSLPLSVDVILSSVAIQPTEAVQRKTRRSKEGLFHSLQERSVRGIHLVPRRVPRD